MLEDGEIQRHIRRVRREYRSRRDTLIDALNRHVSDWMTFVMPAGGIALWTKVSGTIDVDKWACAAREKGVIVIAASTYTFDGRSQPYMRLGFASLNMREIQEGVRRLTAACPSR